MRVSWADFLFVSAFLKSAHLEFQKKGRPILDAHVWTPEASEHGKLAIIEWRKMNWAVGMTPLHWSKNDVIMIFMSVSLSLTKFIVNSFNIHAICY